MSRPPTGPLPSRLTAWLLDTDPALRWQVQRDLLGEPAEVWQATRARVAVEGMGARLADGGWNCAAGLGSPRSSFHSTLNALTGLLYREQHSGRAEGITPLRRRAEEYLLSRRLMYRAGTGEPVGPWATQFGYPTRWQYSVLAALDYFRRAAALDGSRPDPRLAEAIEVVRSRSTADGRWRQEMHRPGTEWFAVDVPVGEPSPWVTLYALRVLRWWDDEAGAA